MKYAQGLVELMRAEQYVQAYEQYFAKDVRAIEVFAYNGSDPITVGRKNLISKAKKRSEKKTPSHSKSATHQSPMTINASSGGKLLPNTLNLGMSIFCIHLMDSKFAKREFFIHDKGNTHSIRTLKQYFDKLS